MESLVPSESTSPRNHDIDDRPTKRACLEALRNETPDLRSPAHDGSDLCDSPLAPSNSANMEDQANLPAVALKSSFGTSSSIPGLGLLDDGDSHGMAEARDLEMMKQDEELKQLKTDVEKLKTGHEESTTEVEPLRTEVVQAGIEQTGVEVIQSRNEELGSEVQQPHIEQTGKEVPRYVPRYGHEPPENDAQQSIVEQTRTEITHSNLKESEMDTTGSGVSKPEMEVVQSETRVKRPDPVVLQSGEEAEIYPSDLLEPSLQGHVEDPDTAMEETRLSHAENSAANEMENVSTNTQDVTIPQDSHDSDPPHTYTQMAATTAEPVRDRPEYPVEAPPGEIVHSMEAVEGSPDVKIERYDEVLEAREGDLEMADVEVESEIQPRNSLPSEAPTKEPANDAVLSTSSDMKDAPDNTLLDPTPDPNNPEWEPDSSPYQSSSSDISSASSSDSSSDDSDEDNEDYQLLSPSEQVRILMQEERGGSDEEDQGSKIKDPTSGHSRLRTTNERSDVIVPIPNITLTPESKITHLGVVESVVENTLLLKARVTGDYQVLESGSMLCLSDRSIIGVVAETLGRVQQPLYTVRFTNAAAIHERGVGEKATEVFYVHEHSSFVFTQALKGIKGSDASNIHDEEVGEHEMEFSDDEKEAEYRRQLKVKKRTRRGGDEGFARPPRGRLRQNGYSCSDVSINTRDEDVGSMISYDDNVGDANMEDGYDEGYTPLARPSNLHEMMGRGEAPQENWNPNRSHPPPNSNPPDDVRSRGGYRGDIRGGSRGDTRGAHCGGMRGGRGRGGFDRGRGRNRRGFDKRRNGQTHEDRRPSQPSYSPQKPQFSSPDPRSQVHQQSQSPSMSSQSFIDPHQQWQPPPQQLHPSPFWPSSQQAQSNSPPLPFNHQTYPQLQPQSQSYQSQLPYSQLSANPFNPPPGSHINPSVWAALQQQQQQQAYTPQTHSQSYPPQTPYSPPPAQNVVARQPNDQFQGNGHRTGPGPVSGQGEAFGGGISEILRRLGSEPGSTS